MFIYSPGCVILDILIDILDIRCIMEDIFYKIAVEIKEIYILSLIKSQHYMKVSVLITDCSSLITKKDNLKS